MPPRKSHTKSRTGCEKCKSRRKKCDEIGPPCTNCKSRNLECRYPDNDFQHSHWTDRSRETVQAQQEKPTISTPRFDSNASGRTRELGLMHHWCLKTCHSFSSEMNDIFQDYAVQLGMRHEFLMDSLLAFTCLHIISDIEDTGSSGNSNQQTIILDDAFRYQERALPVFRTELERISSHNCEALLLCSIIMMAFAAACPLYDENHLNDSEPNRNSESHQTPAGPMSIFFFVKGIHSVIDNAQPWLNKSPLKFVIQLYPKEYWTSSPSEGCIIPRELREICNHNTDLHMQQVCLRATLMLENCSTRDERMALAWVVEVGEAFVSLVQKSEPTALLIYICWGALVGCSKDLWWTRIAGRAVVTRLAPIVRVEAEEANIILNWANERVRVG